MAAIGRLLSSRRVTTTRLVATTTVARTLTYKHTNVGCCRCQACSVGGHGIALHALDTLAVTTTNAEKRTQAQTRTSLGSNLPAKRAFECYTMAKQRTQYNRCMCSFWRCQPAPLGHWAFLWARLLTTVSAHLGASTKLRWLDVGRLSQYMLTL